MVISRGFLNSRRSFWTCHRSRVVSCHLTSTAFSLFFNNHGSNMPVNWSHGIDITIIDGLIKWAKHQFFIFPNRWNRIHNGSAVVIIVISVVHKIFFIHINTINPAFKVSFNNHLTDELLFVDIANTVSVETFVVAFHILSTGFSTTHSMSNCIRHSIQNLLTRNRFLSTKESKGLG